MATKKISGNFFRGATIFKWNFFSKLWCEMVWNFLTEYHANLNYSWKLSFGHEYFKKIIPRRFATRDNFQNIRALKKISGNNLSSCDIISENSLYQILNFSHQEIPRAGISPTSWQHWNQYHHAAVRTCLLLAILRWKGCMSVARRGQFTPYWV